MNQYDSMKPGTQMIYTSQYNCTISACVYIYMGLVRIPAINSGLCYIYGRYTDTTVIDIFHRTTLLWKYRANDPAVSRTPLSMYIYALQAVAQYLNEKARRDQQQRDEYL